MGLIYKIACDITSKCYIGQTKRSLEKRINEHLHEVKIYRRKFPLYNAIRKYGWENFSVEILEDNISLENLTEREIYYTNKYNALAPNGYTLIVGDNHRIFSEETKKKMSNVKKGKIPWNKGVSCSEELKNKISNGNKGKLLGGNHPNSKSILCYDLKENFIKEFDCIMDIERELKINSKNISSVCNGKRNRVGNYKFKYKNNA